MGILRRYANARVDSQPSWQGTVPLTSSVLLEALGLSESGAITSPKQAVQVTAALRATMVLASSIAGAPKFVTKKEDGKLVTSHKLIFEPHPLMDEFGFWEQVMLRLIYAGNFYAIIFREGATGAKPGNPGPISHLEPVFNVEPFRIMRGREWVDTLYVTTIEGVQYGVPATEMFHIAGMGFNGLKGVGVIEFGRIALESAYNGEQFAGKFYSNGSLMSGILTTEKRLDEKSATALKERWRKKIQGIQNAFDIVVLDSGTKFEQISMSPEDAQWLESRKFSVNEMARLFGVHPQLLMETPPGSSSANQSEQKSIDLVQFTLNGWAKRIMAAANRQIMRSTESMVIHLDQLVKPDMRTRSSAAVMWRTANIKTINEQRKDEGLPPVEDERADDVFFVTEKSATTPGTNQGNQEQPVPDDQDPAGQSEGDNNLDA